MADASPETLADPTATTPDERTMAVLVHVLQLIGGWIAPLIIFFLRRQSRFVTFHALQVLLFEAVCLFLTMLVSGAVFLAIAVGFTVGGWPGAQGQGHSGPPTLFFLLFGLLWIGFVVLWLVRLLLAIIYGVKTSRGEWAEYPWLGRLARYILHIGPGGSLIAP